MKVCPHREEEKLKIIKGLKEKVTCRDEFKLIFHTQLIVCPIIIVINVKGRKSEKLCVKSTASINN